MNVIETRNLTKLYHNRRIALNGLDLTVGRGTVFGLIGLLLTFLFAFLVVLSPPGEGLPALQALAKLLGTYPLVGAPL